MVILSLAKRREGIGLNRPFLFSIKPLYFRYPFSSSLLFSSPFSCPFFFLLYLYILLFNYYKLGQRGSLGPHGAEISIEALLALLCTIGMSNDVHKHEGCTNVLFDYEISVPFKKILAKIARGIILLYIIIMYD